MADKKVVGGLKWVKNEIGATLRPVRELVKAGRSDDIPASECNAAMRALEQVQGVLLALQLETPARLAHEMIRLIARMAEGSGTDADAPAALRQAAQVMEQALDQLSSHLDRLDAGFDEPPLSLWSILNAVRTACQESPLTHSELLTFAAVNTDGDSQWMPAALDLLGDVIRQVRPQFHRHLVAWYRGDADQQGLTQLGSLFRQLHGYLKDALLADLFGLAEVFTAALADGRLPQDAQARSLMGHLDWVLKPLAQQPPQWPEVDALTLIEELLAALSDAQISTPLIVQSQSRYGPQATGLFMPPEDSQTIGNDRALAELASAALDEFAELKARFDQLALGDQADHAAFDAFGADLNRLAATLETTEAGGLPLRLRQLASTFAALASGERDLLALETCAMELLGIEAVLLAHAAQRPTHGGHVIAPDMDLSEITAATLREAGYELVRVKESIADAHVEQGATTALAPVRDSLLSVAGALRILGDDPAAEVAEAIGELVQQRYVTTAQVPVAADFEHLADAVAALDLYIGHLQEAMPFGDILITRAGESLAALGVTLAAPPPPLAPEVEPVAVPMPVSELKPEPEPEPETAPEPESEPAEPESAPAFAPDSIEPPISAAFDTIATETAEIDTEFLDIFLEEASEETIAAQSAFASWEANPHDAAALATLRRSFHTLKGSGRLVGALQTGDFAQAIESLLNRLVDEQRLPSEAILSCVADAVERLPYLIAAEADGRAFDIAPTIELANQLREQAIPTTEPAPIAEQSPPEAATPIIDTIDHDSLFADDDELLDIFQEETHEHLAALRAYLERAATGAAQLDESVQRALHTLTGSARMAGIGSIANVTKALELHIKPILSAGAVPDDMLLDRFGRVIDGVAARVDELPAPGTGAALLASLAVEFAALADSPPPAAIPLATETPPIETPPEPLSLDTDQTLATALFEGEEGAFDDVPWSNESDEVAEELTELDIDIEHLEAQALPDWPDVPDLSDPPDTLTAAPTVEAIEAADQTSAPAPEPADSLPAPDPELASIFLEDARDLLDNLDTQFRAWQLAPQELSALDGINRLLHTLKGSARLTGLASIGNLSHALESRLLTLTDGSLREHQDTATDITLELAQRAMDALSVQVDALEHGTPIPLLLDLIAALGAAPLETPPEAVTAPALEPLIQPATIAALDQPTAAPDAGTVSGTPQIRVRSDLLNRLVNQAGEISIYRGRLTQRNGLLRFGLGELDQTVARLREQLRLLEIETQTQIRNRFEREGEFSEYDSAFDPLEFDRFSRLQQLSGSLAETVNDLVSVKDMLGGYQREFADLLTQQARLADDLQDGLLRTRLVPFVQVVPRLHRLVRQTADSLGKTARLEVIGPEVELDRTILDRLVAPLEHLLRNAVDHGLEDPKTRLANGKSATGRVTLSLHREGNDAVISLSDDGKGMNIEAIRRQAITRGLLAPEVELPDDVLLQFILEPGFTTSGNVTQISGRGVGLDVVASEIKAANGTIELESVAGKGARFTVRLPLTLAIIEAFLVAVGDNIYAVPHSTVEAAARIAREDLLAIQRGEGNDFVWLDHHYKVVYLGSVLDPAQTPELSERRWLPLLLTRLGEQRVALHVDSLLESQRILVKPLGPQLAGVRWLSGGTILPDGRVALILDALALLRSGAVRDAQLGATVHAAVEPDSATVCVMVVDDSLTVRRVTSRLLRRQNIDVLTAKDGVEALTLLDERIPDLMLLDIEMPRMDGYELTRHIRRSERLRDLPIIMITSRTGDKHREHAMQLGVDRYLGKPYQESELMSEINALLVERAK